MKNPTCEAREICCVAVSLTAFRIFTNLPLIFTYVSGTGAPLSAILSGVVALMLIYFALKCYRGTDIISRAENSFGITGKYTVSVLILGYLALSAVYTLAEFSRFAKNVAFPATPVWFVTLFFIAAAGIGAAKGLKPLLRICRYFVPFFLAVVFLLILSVLWKSNTANLFPILGTGTANTLGKGLGGILLYSDILLLFLINPATDTAKATCRSAIWGSLLGIFVCFCTVLAFTAKIPYPLSKEEQFPFYLLMKEVYYGRFFQRVDAIVLLTSALWGMFSLSLNLSLMTKILCDTFEISTSRIAISPLCIILFFLSNCNINSLFDILSLFAAVFGVSVIFLALCKPKKEVHHHEK